jgi:hypothetical protein
VVVAGGSTGKRAVGEWAALYSGLGRWGPPARPTDGADQTPGAGEWAHTHRAGPHRGRGEVRKQAGAGGGAGGTQQNLRHLRVGPAWK